MAASADGPWRAWRSGWRGRGRARAGRVFGLGPFQVDRFSFFEFIFNAKTIQEKPRNCLKARKILKKTQKFQENSKR
jgi:hypothetical protein